MVRVVGIDPGTLSIDVCGIVDGQLYLDRSWPTAEALSDPAGLVELLTTPGPPEARGTVLDHLVFVSATVARRRLGIEAGD